jgi:hypothetical protein
MSADPSAFDPYRSPSLPQGPYAGQTASRKPGWLTALCVICIVLGALGLMNALFGAVGAAAGPSMQAMFQPRATPGVPSDIQQAQDQFQDDVAGVQKKHFFPLVASIAFRFIAAVLLLVGGLLCLSLKEQGRKILIFACALALLFELTNSIVQSFMMLDMMTAMNSFAEKLQSSMPQADAPPGLNRMVGWWMRAVMVFQFILIYLFSLAKAAVYLFGVIYLQKQHIKALFK